MPFSYITYDSKNRLMYSYLGKENLKMTYARKCKSRITDEFGLFFPLKVFVIHWWDTA